MQTSFPTTDIDEYSWYTVFNTGPECRQNPQYFHYTNLDNRKLILRDDCIDLRFTRADCFADEQEMMHIVQIIEDVCTELLERGCIDRAFYTTIKQSIVNAKTFLIEFRKFYVFCLSTNGNSLHMKENYACKGGKDGVIIGIQGLALEDLQFYTNGEADKTVDGINMYDVIYDKDEIYDGFCKIIKTMYKLARQDAESKKATERTIYALITYGLAYKPPAFEKEEETRIIVDASKLSLPTNRYYQNDKRYLHIKLPIGALYNEVIVNV